MELIEPDNPAAAALAKHISDYPISTIQAAFRILGFSVSFELKADACPQCGTSGACNGGPCALVKPPVLASLSACRICVGVVSWVDAPTGGWWAHDRHPDDHHNAEPFTTSCRSAFMRLREDAELCVVHGPHESHNGLAMHRGLSGMTWNDLGEEVYQD